MPTLNEYVGDGGYYILARPPDAGNITYQVAPPAEPILEKLGHRDGDEVNWRTIQALKVPDLVYTGEQGVSDTDDVDLAAAVENSVEDLTSRQAQTLLEELQSQANLSTAQFKEVEDVLREQIETRFSQLETSLKQSLRQAGRTGDLSALTLSDYEFIVDVSDLRNETDEGLCNIGLTGTLDDPFNEPYQHGIFVCGEHGIEHWQCRADFEESWAFKSEMYRQMAEFLPIIIRELDAIGIDPGSPKDSPPPEIDRWQFE